LEHYGGFGLFLILVVSTPIFEELIFRGVLLNAMAKHISFGWANLIQAGLFAAIHEQATMFVYYLSIGLVMGWMLRRSHSILPGIISHAMINGLAAGALILSQ